MAIILSEAAQIEDFLYRELQKHFSKKLVDVRERIRLVPDLYKFKTEDPYFWGQAKGKIPQHYSLYFDDEFVCDFDSTHPPEAILLQFWRGLTQLYEQRKIYFDKGLYKAEEDIIKDEKKKEARQRKERVRKAKAPPEVKAVLNKLLKENGKGDG